MSSGQKPTPDEMASTLRSKAQDLEWAARDLRILADWLSSPDLPEPSRSSHMS